MFPDFKKVKNYCSRVSYAQFVPNRSWIFLQVHILEKNRKLCHPSNVMSNILHNFFLFCTFEFLVISNNLVGNGIPVLRVNRIHICKKRTSGNENQTIKRQSIAFCELDSRTAKRKILDNENTRHSSLASDHLLAASSNPLFVRTIWKLPRSGTSSVLLL